MGRRAPFSQRFPRPGLSPRFISMTRWPTDRVSPQPPHCKPGNGRGTRRARLACGDSVPERDGPIPTSALPCRPTASRRPGDIAPGGVPTGAPGKGAEKGLPGDAGLRTGRPGKSRRNSDNSGPGPRAGRAHSGPCVCVGVGQVQAPVLAPVPDLLLIRRRTKTSRTPPAAPAADARKPSCRCSPHRQGALAVRLRPGPHAGSPRPTPTTHRPRGARLPFLTFPDLLLAARHSDLCLDRETAARRRPGRRGDPSAP